MDNSITNSDLNGTGREETQCSKQKLLLQQLNY